MEARRQKRARVAFPTEKELRDGGRLCPDGQWRYIITLEDAIAGGFNLASIDKLRNRYNRDTFNMLYMCVFVDSKDSVFSFSTSNVAVLIRISGRIMTKTCHDHSAIVKCGQAMTLHAAGTHPPS